MLGAAAAAQVEPLVLKPLALQALAYAELAEEIDRVLLEQPGAYSCLHVLTIACLEHHRVDALALEQERQRETGRAGADNCDLGAHVRAPRCSSTDRIWLAGDY